MTRKVFVVCFGISGRRIWGRLTRHSSIETMLPMMVENIKTIPFLFGPLGQKKVIIVSQLDDPKLTATLFFLERNRVERRFTVTGYFTHPFYGSENYSGNIVANLNLRRSYEVFDNLRVTNLPDYAEGSIRPSWPLQFYDDKMTDGEKQIVWELLKCYHRNKVKR